MICCDKEFNPVEFRHTIEIEQLSLVANDTGGQDETWTTFTTAWASIKPKIVREVNFAQRIEPRTDHDIRMRYQAGITASMRIKFGTRYFEIKAIRNVDEVNEFLHILAAERTGT